MWSLLVEATLRPARLSSWDRMTLLLWAQKTNREGLLPQPSPDYWKYPLSGLYDL